MCEWTDDGLAIQHDRGTSTLPWTMFHAWQVGPHTMSFYQNSTLFNAIPRDLNGDDVPEVMAMSEEGDTAIALVRDRQGIWRKAGTFDGPQDAAARAAIAAGDVAPLAPILPDLRVGGARLRFDPDSDYQTVNGSASTRSDRPTGAKKPR